MRLDLTRPEHLDCVGYACLNRLSPDHDHDGAMREAYLAQFRSRPDDAEARFALVLEAERALSSPSDSAALVRALLEGCRVDASVDPWRQFESRPGDVGVCIIMGEWYMIIQQAHVPTLVLRLLACTNREEALTALKKAGR